MTYENEVRGVNSSTNSTMLKGNPANTEKSPAASKHLANA